MATLLKGEKEWLWTENSLRNTAEKHVHFIDLSVPEMMEDLLRKLNEQNKQHSLIDLGWGDGRLLHTLYSKGLPKNASKIIWVDISIERIENEKALSLCQGDHYRCM